MKSPRLQFRPESFSCWGALSLLLLVSSGPGLAEESEDSRAITSPAAAAAADAAPPDAGEEATESVEDEKSETEGPSFLRPTEESEVLEERRAGAEKVEDALPQDLKKTGLYWDYGPHYDALDGNLRLVFGSRLHLDAAYYDESSAMEEIGESDDDTEVRRAFAHVAGVLFRQFEFKLQVNFANQFDVRDLYVGVVKVPFLSAVRVGYTMEPFGLERLASSNDSTFMERALTTVFTPNRNTGVLLHRRFTENRRLYAAVGLFEDTVARPDFGEIFQDVGDGNLALTGRVTGLPVRSEDGRQLVHVGVAASYREPLDETLRFKSRPESHLAQNYVDTGEFDAEDELRLGFEFGNVLGSFSLQSEFMLDVVSDDDHGLDFDDRLFPAFYVQASYVLTGEHRSYREQIGAFGRVHPRNPFPLEGWGAWEVAARYSFLDLDSKDVDGGVLHDWTVGLNWYTNHYSRVMVNYVLAHPEGLDFAHIVQMRLQIAF